MQTISFQGYGNPKASAYRPTTPTFSSRQSQGTADSIHLAEHPAALQEAHPVARLIPVSRSERMKYAFKGGFKRAFGWKNLALNVGISSAIGLATTILPPWHGFVYIPAFIAAGLLIDFGLGAIEGYRKGHLPKLLKA
jgi:hypothetical protein